MRFLPTLLAPAATAILLAAPLAAQSALEQEPEGWVDLLPDQALKGWTRIPVPPTDGVRPELQWKVDPANGLLVCRGDVQHEWLRYDKELTDFILHVEWRFKPKEGQPSYNSGVGVRMSPYIEIWHQAQTGPRGGYLFGNTFRDGFLQRVSLSKEMSENRVRPAGEWNTYEVRCQGDVISLWVNGATVNVWKGVQVRKGYIGLEAEGYEITFRNIKLKELP